MPPIDDNLVLATRTLEHLLLPPGSPLLIALLGLVFMLRRSRYGLPVLGLGLALAYLTSLPLVARGLAQWLEPYPALDPVVLCGHSEAAIVVLGGPDRYELAPEYGGDTLGPLALERVRYGAYLHRLCGMPILVVGGKSPSQQLPGAQMMEAALTREFGVTTVWGDGRSRSTFDNARFARELLTANGISTVALVTHGWHMRRAVASFAGEGLVVLPAPTGFVLPGAFDRGWRGLLPNAWALVQIRWMLREVAGIALLSVFPSRTEAPVDGGGRKGTVR